LQSDTRNAYGPAVRYRKGIESYCEKYTRNILDPAILVILQSSRQELYWILQTNTEKM
jgi:hypothetical protein